MNKCGNVPSSSSMKFLNERLDIVCDCKKDRINQSQRKMKEEQE